MGGHSLTSRPGWSSHSGKHPTTLQLNNLLCSVNKPLLADGDYLKFTCVLWLQEGKGISPKEEDCCDELVKVCAKDYFPHLSRDETSLVQ